MKTRSVNKRSPRPLKLKSPAELIMSERHPMPPPSKRFDDRRYRKPKHPHRSVDCSEPQE